MTDKRMKILTPIEDRPKNSFATYGIPSHPDRVLLIRGFECKELKTKIQVGKYYLFSNCSLIATDNGEYLKLTSKSRVSPKRIILLLLKLK